MIPIDDATAAPAMNGRPKPAKGPPTFVIGMKAEDPRCADGYLAAHDYLSDDVAGARKFTVAADADAVAAEHNRYSPMDAPVASVVALPGWPETADRIGEEARREWLARNGKQGAEGGPTP